MGYRVRLVQHRLPEGPTVDLSGVNRIGVPPNRDGSLFLGTRRGNDGISSL